MPKLAKKTQIINAASTGDLDQLQKYFKDELNLNEQFGKVDIDSKATRQQLRRQLLQILG